MFCAKTYSDDKKEDPMRLEQVGVSLFRSLVSLNSSWPIAHVLCRDLLWGQERGSEETWTGWCTSFKISCSVPRHTLRKRKRIPWDLNRLVYLFSDLIFCAETYSEDKKEDPMRLEQVNVPLFRSLFSLHSSWPIVSCSVPRLTLRKRKRIQWDLNRFVYLFSDYYLFYIPPRL